MVFAYSGNFDPLSVNLERAVVVHAQHHVARGGFSGLKRFHVDVPIPAVAKRAAFLVEGVRSAARVGAASVGQGIDVVIEVLGVHRGIVKVKI